MNSKAKFICCLDASLTAPGLLPGSAMASELVEFVRNQTHDVTFDFCETIIVPLMASLGHDEVAASRAGF